MGSWIEAYLTAKIPPAFLVVKTYTRVRLDNGEQGNFAKQDLVKHSYRNRVLDVPQALGEPP